LLYLKIMCNTLYQRGYCEEAKTKTVSAQQSMCEHRVNWR